MAKSELKLKAKGMREGGESIKKIAEILGVSSSTVSLWCRDIKLTERQINELEKRNNDPYYGRRGKYLEKVKRERDRKVSELQAQGTADIGKLSDRDLFIAGAALYWAEGFKKDRMVGFANSDPLMLKFILRWLVGSIRVSKERLRFRAVVNESHKYRIDEIQRYWSSLIKFPLEQFYKPTFQKSRWSKSYEYPEEYFGILRIRILKSTDLLRKIEGMIRGLRS